MFTPPSLSHTHKETHAHTLTHTEAKLNSYTMCKSCKTGYTKTDAIKTACVGSCSD